MINEFKSIVDSIIAEIQANKTTIVDIPDVQSYLEKNHSEMYNKIRLLNIVEIMKIYIKIFMMTADKNSSVYKIFDYKRNDVEDFINSAVTFTESTPIIGPIGKI